MAILIYIILIVAIGNLGYRTLGGILGVIEGSSKSEELLPLFRILGL
jgi:hypothetical protein